MKKHLMSLLLALITAFGLSAQGSDPCGDLTIDSLPYSENFDSYGVHTYENRLYPYLPCWTKKEGASAHYPFISPSRYVSAPGSLYFSSGFWGSTIAILPRIAESVDITSLRLRFAMQPSSVGHRLIVGVMTDNTDSTTFFGIDTIAPDSRTTWTNVSVNFSSYTGAGKYIALKVECNPDTHYGNLAFVDDLVLEIVDPCEQTLPYTEGFESINSDGELPACMNRTSSTKVSTHTSTIIGQEYYTYYMCAHSGNNYATFSMASNDVLFTPKFSLNANNAYTFSFYYKTDGRASNWQTFQPYLFSSTAAADSVQRLGEYTPTFTSADTTYTLYTVSFTPSTSGDYYIGIYCKSSYGAACLAIDDLALELTGSNVVILPSIMSVRDSAITSSSAILKASIALGQNANILSKGFEYKTSSEENYTQVLDNTSDSVSLLTNLTNLQSATTYSYRAYLNVHRSTSDTTIYSPIHTFSTPCAAMSLPYTENFDTLTANNNMPACMYTSSLGNKVYTYASAPSSANGRVAHSGNGFMSFKYYCNDYIFTPPFDLKADSIYQFSFYYITDGNNGWQTLETKLCSEQSSSAEVMPIGDAITNFNNNTYRQYTATFTPSVSGLYYIGIHCKAGSAPLFMSIDDIGLSELDPSTPILPSISSTSSDSITGYTAHLYAKYNDGMNVTINERGFAYKNDMDADYTFVAGQISDDTMHVNLSSLLPNGTLYHYKGYIAYNGGESVDTIYGEEKTFSTEILCHAPTNIAANINGDNDITVTITPYSESDGSWIVYYKNDTETNYDSVFVNSTSQTIITSAASATTYTMYAKTDCSDDGTSTATSSISISTPCDATTNFPYTENFDGSTLAICWSNENVIGTYNWQSDNSYYQTSPYSRIVKISSNSSSRQVTRLLSPVFDLSNIANPKMSFSHIAKDWSGDIDSLAILYKSSAEDDWTTLAEYGIVNNWTLDTLTLLNPSSTYRIAFEARMHYGRGIGLDSVVITGSEQAIVYSYDTLETYICQGAYYVFGEDTIYNEGTYTDTNIADTTINVLILSYYPTEHYADSTTHTSDMSGLLSNSESYEVCDATTGTLTTDGYYHREFVSNGLVFEGLAYDTYGYLMSFGFSPCNMTAEQTSGYYGNYLVSASQNGVGGAGDTYLTSYYSDYMGYQNQSIVRRPDNSPFFAQGVYVNNSIGAYNYMNSASFGSDKWEKLTIIGCNANGDSIGSIDLYLGQNGAASFSNWTYVDLSTLPATNKIRFVLSSNDLSYGYLNVPSYFCIDNFSYKTDTTSFVAPITEVSICEGESYSFGTQTLTLSGIYHDTVANQYGCDSVVTLNLTVNPLAFDTIDAEICEGEQYNFAGTTLNVQGTYYDTLQTLNGCDSIFILTLTINQPTAHAYTETICEGEEYTFGNQHLTAAGTYLDTLTNALGCDSIVTLTLVVNPISAYSYEDSVVEGQTYHFGDRDLTTAGTYYDTLTNQYGCDSVVTLTLTLSSGLMDVENAMSISLYPNPTEHNATLSVEGLNADATIILTDQQGRTIQRIVLPAGQKTTEINTKELASGVYYVRVISGTMTRTQKLIRK